MSRIAGIYSYGLNGAPATVELNRAARAFPLQPNWRAHNAPTDHGVISWYGADASRVFVRDRFFVVLDGVLYNRGELRAERDESDAAVFARLCAARGFEQALQSVNGDFAVAVYDAATNTLWLGRDRLGVKPLYFTSACDLGFAFASVPHVLTALPGVGAEPDPRFVGLFAASHYRTFDNLQEASPYARVAQLPAAHWLRIDRDGVRSGKYWSLEPLPDWPDDEQTLAQRYRELLQRAVSERLSTTRRPAFTLSGGMDSSSVLASAVESTGNPQTAFSAVYADPTFDESNEIQPMLGSKVAQWHPIHIGTPDVFGLVQRMVQVHGEPVATATWLSHFLINRSVSEQGFDALFGGLGGDELNAGEYEYFFFHFADLRAAGRENDLDVEIEKWVAYHDHPIHRKSRQVAEHGIARMTDAAVPGRCLPDRERILRYVDTLEPDVYDLSAFEPVMDGPFSSYMKNRTYQDLFRETAPCCLRAEDRHSAAFGVEHFDPFYDYRVVEFMFRVPGDKKIRAGVTKILLREAMKGVLPEETRTRVKKVGWNAPAHVWFSGADAEPLRDLISSRAFRERGVYRVGEVERLLEEHNDIVASGAPRIDHMMFLWQLVNLELWLQGLDQRAPSTELPAMETVSSQP